MSELKTYVAPEVKVMAFGHDDIVIASEDYDTSWVDAEEDNG